MLSPEDVEDVAIKKLYNSYHNALKEIGNSSMPEPELDLLVAHYESYMNGKLLIANTTFKLDIADSRLAIINKEKKL